MLASLMLMLCACGPSGDAESPETEWESMDTGLACAKAKVACGSGNCISNTTNDCGKPITCKLKVEGWCQGYDGNTGESRGTSKLTLLAKERRNQEVTVDCDEGQLLSTRIQTFDCE